MIGFLIKKTFFDLWDNLFRIVFINVGLLALATIPVFLPSLIPVPVLKIVVLGVGIMLCFVYLAAAALCIRRVSDYSYFGFRDFFAAFKDFKKTWLSGLVAGGFAILVGIVVGYVFPFYFSAGSLISFGLGILLFWFFAAALVAFQFFFSFRIRMDNPVRISVKKCFIIFFDNLGFSIFAFLHNIIILALSVLTAFIAPGPAGVILFMDEALRLRMLKYDWLEAHPEVLQSGKRPKIPWDELLIDERENTGTRSFKSFIFPWKD